MTVDEFHVSPTADEGSAAMDFADFTVVARSLDSWVPLPLVVEQDEVEELPVRAAQWLRESCPVEVTL